MEKIKVFVDTNILFSAIYNDFKGSYPSLLIKLGLEKHFELYISNLVEFEIKKNVLKKQPHKEILLNNLLSKINKLEDVLIDIEEIKNLPIADKVLLSTAVYNEIDFFITGNKKDFLFLYRKTIYKTKILTPKDFLEKNWD